MGTVGYVAPEQIRGKGVERRTDVYALGCVLFECLTGTPPFPRKDDFATIMAHVNDAPPLVVRAAAGHAGRRSRTWSQRALAKAPEDRFDNCDELGSALRRAAGRVGHDAAAGARARRGPTGRVARARCGSTPTPRRPSAGRTTPRSSATSAGSLARPTVRRGAAVAAPRAGPLRRAAAGEAAARRARRRRPPRRAAAAPRPRGLASRSRSALRVAARPGRGGQRHRARRRPPRRRTTATSRPRDAAADPPRAAGTDAGAGAWRAARRRADGAPAGRDGGARRAASGSSAGSSAQETVTATTRVESYDPAQRHVEHGSRRCRARCITPRRSPTAASSS